MFCAFCNENLGPAEPGTLNNKIAVNAIALQVKIQDRDIKIARLNNRIAELEAEIESHHKELDLAAKHERERILTLLLATNPLVSDSYPAGEVWFEDILRDLLTPKP